MTNLHAPSQIDLFAAWLSEHGEVTNISARKLRTLYAEFVDVTGTASLSSGQLHRRLRDAGIVRRREPHGQRRWYYQVVLLARPSLDGEGADD